MRQNRLAIIAASVIAAALVITGLVLPGIAGGLVLLAVAIALAALTTAVITQGEASFDNRAWAVRFLVIVAIAAIGLVKIFRH